MPTFSFKGFENGAPVALSVTQGSGTESASVQSWGQGSLANISILQVDSGELVSPAGLWFEATGLSGFDIPDGPASGETYDPSFHDITYIWDFGDAGAFDPSLNIPDVWRDRNLAYGKRTAHVFRTPGVYTVSVWAVDRSGTTGSASVTVTVADPDDVYTGSRTICYSDTNDFAGAPTGAQQVSSASALRTAVENLSQTGRVLFKRGSDQTLSVDFGGPQFNQNIRIGAWGDVSLPRPILRPPRNATVFSIGQDTPVRDRVLESLDFRGDWDPTTETGGFSSGAFGVLLSDAEGLVNVMHDCRFSGLRSVDLSTLKPISFVSIVNDCIIQDWSEYGFYAHSQIDGVNDNSRVALIGSAFQQNPDACNGAKEVGYVGLGNQQGSVRYETTRKWVMRSCYCFSNTSWALGSQSCIRIATDNPGGVELICDRITFEGSSAPVELLGYTANKTGNFLFDRLFLPGSADTNVFFQSEYSGVTLRNAFAYMPDVPRLGGPDSGHIVGLAQSPLSEPVKVYNCSVLYMKSGTDVALQDGLHNYTNLTFENSFLHAPNQDTPETSSNPVDLSGTVAGFQPRYKGRRNSISRPMVALGSWGPGNGVSFTYPTAPDGSTPTTVGDFATTGRHWLKNLTSGELFYADQGDFSVSFSASVDVVNTSGSAWAGGDYYLVLDYLGYVTDTQYASPGSIPLMRPLPGSAAYETVTQSGSLVALDDFALTRRPGLPAPGSPAGNSSRGSIEG